MDNRVLLSLLKKEEGTKLDFKLKLNLSTDSSKRELAKDICAIANSKGSRGYIIVGIQDKSKNIVGIKKEDNFTEEQIQQIISRRCEPPIPLEVDFTNIKNKKVAVITIYDGGQRPYQVRENGSFYIRRGSTTDTMRKQELIALLEENLSLTIETCPIMRSNIKMLNMDIVNKYFEQKGVILTDENRDFLLLSSGIAFQEKNNDTLKCTYGGLLVFSDMNYLSIPNNMIKIIDRRDKDNEKVWIIQGNLLDMVDKAESRIYKIMNKSYPSNAIVEAIKNAVLYREYFDLNRIIEVIVEEDSVKIVSPGELISKEEINKSYYDKRNIWLYEKLITLDEKQRFLNNGKGFIRIKEAFQSRGNVEFINSIENHSFDVVLPGCKQTLDCKVIDN